MDMPETAWATGVHVGLAGCRSLAPCLEDRLPGPSVPSTESKR